MNSTGHNMEMTTTDSHGPYAILWSHNQGCWHTEPLHDTWKKNLDVLLTKNWLGDYCLVAMANTGNEADQIIDILENKMSERHGKNWKEKQP